MTGHLPSRRAHAPTAAYSVVLFVIVVMRSCGLPRAVRLQYRAPRSPEPSEGARWPMLASRALRPTVFDHVFD